jgi:hypothetical protein
VMVMLPPSAIRLWSIMLDFGWIWYEVLINIASWHRRCIGGHRHGVDGVGDAVNDGWQIECHV